MIKLGPRDTIVLGYLKSCWRETITGGTVTVGAEQSEVKAARSSAVGSSAAADACSFRGTGSPERRRDLPRWGAQVRNARPSRR